MKCNYCDAEISINSIKCPYCGGLVQMVPDYNPLDDLLVDQINIQDSGRSNTQNIPVTPPVKNPSQKRNTSVKNPSVKKASGKNTGKNTVNQWNNHSSSDGTRRELTDREKMRRKRARMKRLRRRRRNLLLAMLFTLIAICTIISLCVSNFSYGGIIKKGYKALNKSDYAIAETRFNSAINKNATKADGYKGLSETYLAQGLTEQAENVYLSYIEKDNTNYSIYDSLIQFYISSEKQDKIPGVLADVDEKLLSKLNSYVVELPSYSLDEKTTYDEVQELSLTTADNCKIYYTDNGTVPTIRSKEYKEAILLQEGNTTIKAISVNEQGIPSQIASKSYKVVLPLEDAPAVSPSTGQYNYDIDVEIKVPEGYTAYYTMDGTDPTTASYMYYAPLRMPLGETIFKAILVNASGKASNITTKSYVVDY